MGVVEVWARVKIAVRVNRRSRGRDEVWVVRVGVRLISVEVRVRRSRGRDELRVKKWVGVKVRVRDGMRVRRSRGRDELRVRVRVRVKVRERVEMRVMVRIRVHDRWFGGGCRLLGSDGVEGIGEVKIGEAATSTQPFSQFFAV